MDGKAVRKKKGDVSITIYALLGILIMLFILLMVRYLAPFMKT